MPSHPLCPAPGPVADLLAAAAAELSLACDALARADPVGWGGAASQEYRGQRAADLALADTLVQQVGAAQSAEVTHRVASAAVATALTTGWG